APLRPRAGGAAGRARGRPPRAGGQRGARREDPYLQLPRAAGDRSPHRPQGAQPARGPRRGSRRAHRGAPGRGEGPPPRGPLGGRMTTATVTSATTALAEAGCDTPRLDAEVLLAEAAEVDRLTLLTRDGAALSGSRAERFQTLVERRVRREP